MNELVSQAYCTWLADLKQRIQSAQQRAGVATVRNLIEQCGSGVRRIFSEAKELGQAEPQIVELGMRVRVVVQLAEAVPVVQVTEQVGRFLECLKRGPLSAQVAMK